MPTLLQQHIIGLFNGLPHNPNPQPAVGIIPEIWANRLLTGLGTYYNLSPNQIDRTYLQNMWRNNNNSTEACILSTMAWGGMRADHGRTSWAALNNWLPICNNVRAGKYTRQQGFDAFINLRPQGLPGMGPAYFTKILFFASSKADAYILDQWTARSIHILTNQRSWPSVSKPAANQLSRKIRVTVTDQVTAIDYENYCLMIEALAIILGSNVSSIEERMFGVGGRHPSPWRTYVMNNWINLPP